MSKKTYLVAWEIEIDAESALGAAREAQRIQRDPNSTATVFNVIEFDTNGEAEQIDLDWTVAKS